MHTTTTMATVNDVLERIHRSLEEVGRLMQEGHDFVTAKMRLEAAESNLSRIAPQLENDIVAQLTEAIKALSNMCGLPDLRKNMSRELGSIEFFNHRTVHM
jgi:hypothetical protein